jgi:hypothetical protein
MARRVFTRKAGPSSRVRNRVDTGIILGRTSKGHGPIEYLSIEDLIQQAKQAGYIQSGPTEHGIGFFIGGLMTADELLGGVVFSNPMRFSNSAKKSVVSQVQATAIATFSFVTGFPDTVVGTIVFGAGSSVGTVTWSPNPFNLPAGQQVRLRSPNPADLTLAYVSGTIDGDIQ